MKHDRPIRYAAAPGGIERLVALAAHDPKFRERLFADRLRAARKARVRLTDSEKTLLAAIPDSQLAMTIDNASPAKPARRGFLQIAAGFVAVLLGGAALSGCPGPGPVGGARPDEPEPATDGMREDEPPVGTAADRARGEESEDDGTE